MDFTLPDTHQQLREAVRNFAEKEIGANEDKILELMVNAEVREKEVKAAEAELKEETAEIEKEKKMPLIRVVHRSYP